MIYFSENLQAHKLQFNFIVFDVDGVLVDTSLSFPLAIAKSIKHYGKLIGFPDWKEPEIVDVALFKTFSGFNNEWDLDEGLLLFYLQEQLLCNPVCLKEFLKQTAQLDVGVAGIKKWIHQLSGEKSEKIFSCFQAELIRKLAMEYYAGKEFCEFLYGFKPEFNVSQGTLNAEKVLIDKHLLRRLSNKFEFGIYTGRNLKECELIYQKIGPEYFNKKAIFCDDGNQQHLKPNAAPLEIMLRKSGKNGLIFTGDSLDDFQTMQNFQEKYPQIKAEFVQVLDNKEPFHKEISVVESVNQLLHFLIQE